MGYQDTLLIVLLVTIGIEFLFIITLFDKLKKLRFDIKMIAGMAEGIRIKSGINKSELFPIKIEAEGIE